MYMQIAVFILGMLLLSSPVAAGTCKSELIGLTATFFSEGKQWAITWKADGVHKEKADYYGNNKNRTNEYASMSDYRAEHLPHNLLNSNKKFNVPFDISKKEGLLVSAVHNGSNMDHKAKEFAIVDLKNQKIIQRLETEYGIGSLAWSPDSKYFAVLYAQDVTKDVFKGPIDWLAEYLGHGNGYWTFYLRIYLPDGTPVCTEEVAKKISNAMSYIDWEMKKQFRTDGVLGNQ